LLRVGCREHVTHNCTADLAAKLIWVTAVAAFVAIVTWRGMKLTYVIIDCCGSHRANQRRNRSHAVPQMCVRTFRLHTCAAGGQSQV
jgi:hypothetical protein